MPLTRRLIVAVLAAAVLGPTTARAVCNLPSVCTFNDLASCCVGTTCTLDGTITVRGPACNLDFGTHNISLTGTLAVGSTTLSIEALSFTISGSGLVDARGSAGNPGGNVTITTTDGLASSFALTGNASSGILLTGFGAVVGGGTLAVHAAGAVNLSGGKIDASSADPNGNESGGTISIDSTAGDLTVGIPLLANAGIGGLGGTIMLTFPGNITVTDSGRIKVFGGLNDAGTIEITAGGAVTVTNAALIQADGIGSTGGSGGEIDITGGSFGVPIAAGLVIDGTVEATGASGPTLATGGSGGSINLEAQSGALVLMPGTQAISVDGAGGGGGGDMSLTTDSPTSGDITISAPVTAIGNGSAGGGQIEVASAAGITVAKTIDASGVDEASGSIDLTAARDVVVQASLRVDDPIGGGTVTITANHDIAFSVGAGSTVKANGSDSTTTAPGGAIALAGGNNVTITGFLFNATGAGTGAGGQLAVTAGRNLTVATGTTLDASGGGSAHGGQVVLLAGLSPLGAEDQTGDLEIDGTLRAVGNDASGASPASVQLGGCQVTISATGLVDSRGDRGSFNTVVGRNALAGPSPITINGTLRATAATGSNQPTYPVGTTPTVGPGAVVVPPFPDPNVCPNCAQPKCTQRTPPAPAGCLMPCPQCGDGVLDAPFEDCDPGNGNPCDANCDIHCRTLVPTGCDDKNQCTADSCDPVFGCINEKVRDGTVCDDHNACTTADTCHSGVCVGGPPPNCSDGKGCTIDTCDPATGCVNTPITSCPPDPNKCYGPPPPCSEPGCTPGPLKTCPAGQVCNPADGNCVPKPCTVDADCDDQNPCTTDSCNTPCATGMGTCCSNVAKADGTPCPDNTVCNGEEKCAGGVCAPGSPLNCDDMNACTVDSCDAVAGCQHMPIVGCCNVPADCPASNLCTSCTNHACGVIAGCCLAPADCDDGNPCTDDNCTGMTAHLPGRCTHTAADGEACGDVCNSGTCFASVCQSTPIVCPSMPCMHYFCDPTAPDPTHPCVLQVQAGCCQRDADCDDHNACTTDTCQDLAPPSSPEGYCTHTPVPVDCKPCISDQDCAPGYGACAGKRCLPPGICKDVAPPNCDNAPANFSGTCVLGPTGEATCKYTCLRNEACDDHNACNGMETCSAATGACVAGTPPDCNSHDLCMTDGCDPATGCSHTPKASFDGVGCRLDTMDSLLNGAAPGDISAATRGKLAALIGKARAKLSAAQSIGTGKRAQKQLKAAGKQLKAIAKAVNAALKKKNKIAPMLAHELLDAAAGGTGALGNIKT